MKKGLFVLLLITAFAAPAFSQTDCPVSGAGDQKTKKTAAGTNQTKKVVGKNTYSEVGC